MFSAFTTYVVDILKCILTIKIRLIVKCKSMVIIYNIS